MSKDISNSMEEKDDPILESKGLSAVWHIKCTPQQKELLQKKAAGSGKAVAEFIVDSVQQAALKEALSADKSGTQQEFAAVDGMIERLHHLINAKMYMLIEKEKAAAEVQESFTRREEECEQEYERLKDKLLLEYQEKNKTLEERFEKLTADKMQREQATAKAYEQDLIVRQEKIELLESRLDALEREKKDLQQKRVESARSFEIADERLLELRIKVKEMEDKVKQFDAIRERNIALERENAVMAEKIASFQREEAAKLKKEYELKNS